MAQKGINRALILAKAIELIEESGKPDISMAEIAAALQIRTPSLYNHVKNVQELYLDVISCAADRLYQAQIAAIAGLERDEAITALAAAYRTFVHEHPGLYQIIMTSPSHREAVVQNAGAAAAEPITAVLAQYGLTGDDAIHWHRILRSIIHGFLSQEEAGFFRHSPVSMQDSYQLAIRCFLNALHDELVSRRP